MTNDEARKKSALSSWLSFFIGHSSLPHGPGVELVHAFYLDITAEIVLMHAVELPRVRLLVAVRDGQEIVKILAYPAGV